MEIISSPANRLVGRINKLKQKKYRQAAGEFFVEGYKNVLDTYNACPSAVIYVILSESAYKAYGDKFDTDKTVIFSDAIFEKLSETETAQGVLSVNKLPPSAYPTGDRCILLDRVRDPGNVGTIVRTAVACGYDVVVNNCADLYSPKVTRSGMSAIVKCRIGVDIPPAELKSRGYEIIVADMGGDDVFNTPAPRGKYCVVVGNEANGVDSDIISTADRILGLPQNDMESLNAAVAAGVMMFALRYALK